MAFCIFLILVPYLCLSVPLIELNVKENLIFRLIFSDSFVYALANGSVRSWFHTLCNKSLYVLNGYLVAIVWRKRLYPCTNFHFWKSASYIMANHLMQHFTKKKKKVIQECPLHFRRAKRHCSFLAWSAMYALTFEGAID